MPKLPATNRFQKLVEDISRMYLNAREAQVRFAWETGRRIVEEEQNGAMRAEYGAGLIAELSKVLSAKHGPGFSTNTLRKMRQFYSLNPIQPLTVKLAWTDYVELMPIRDEKTRKRIQQRILKEGLKSHEVRREVRRLRLEQQEHEEAPSVPEKVFPPLKRPAGLKLNTFALSPLKVKLKDNHVLIDCGFFVSRPVLKDELKKIDTASGMSYTYAATIDRVVDGDTLLVLIDVGFGIIVRDRLRLRGINCPEVSTPEGIRAKKHVEKLLPPGSTAVIKSHKDKTDIYGRFVADVFYQEGVDGAEEIIKNGVYLNQELLDQGLAGRVEY